MALLGVEVVRKREGEGSCRGRGRGGRRWMLRSRRC